MPVGETDQPKTSMISLRLAREEEESLRRLASERGESLSQFIREAVLEKTAPQPVAAADVSAFATSVTSGTSGIAIENEGGRLIARPIGPEPYVALGGV